MFKSLIVSSWTFPFNRNVFICLSKSSLIGHYWSISTNAFRYLLNLFLVILAYPPLQLHVAIFSPNIHSLEGSTLAIAFFYLLFTLLYTLKSLFSEKMVNHFYYTLPLLSLTYNTGLKKVDIQLCFKKHPLHVKHAVIKHQEDHSILLQNLSSPGKKIDRLDKVTIW